MRVLISGASGNVGRACMLHFASQDWDIVGVSRSITSPIPDEWKKHNEYFRKVETHHLSLCLDIDVNHFLINQPPFDLVIMAHGVQQPAELGTANFIDTYYSVMDGNLTSSVFLTQALIEQDKLNEGALIVYCSSIHSTQPRKSRGPYAIAKAGLEALTKIVAVEGAGNWRAVGLRLGQLESDGRPAAMKGIRFSPEQLETLKGRCLTPWVKCENVAKLCLSLYGQTEISGAILDVDSGHSLNIWP